MMTKISEDYKFYAAFLRFVADKTDKSDVLVHAMMGELDQVANQIEDASSFTILARRGQAASRAFAGVAQFLQHRILPESQAHGDQRAIAYLEWSIAASLQIGRAILLHLEKVEPEELPSAIIEVKMPALDRIAGEHENKDKPTLH